jgi:D-alanyl-D-alanine carboxypeptidase/D-alanyl-D-alanine-endopeptidase (penicillin-binding protein 4)
VIPASNIKLLTAVAALEVLGPDFAYTTKVLGLSEANQIVGDLWLVGGGDPLLSTIGYPLTENYPTLHPTNIGLLIDELVAAGITEITGNIVGDESRYDTERFTPSLGLGVRTTEVGPLGALMLNDGVVLASPIKPDQPALSASQEFLRLLNERGIVVRGGAKVGTASVDLPVVASIDSAPLRDVVTEMLTNSDNNTAELILKEIGLARLSAGTRIAGTQVVQSVLQEFGLPVDGLVIVDGSGLDRGNRATCSLFTSILEKDGGFGLLGNGLAVAGQSGTLRDLLGESAASERLHAKTGTLTGAKALSGYVTYAPDKAATFSLILNGSGVSNQGEYRPIWNGLANALGALSEHPSVADIAP